MVVIPWPHWTTQSVFAIHPATKIEWIVTATHFTSHLHTKLAQSQQTDQHTAYYGRFSTYIELL